MSQFLFVYGTLKIGNSHPVAAYLHQHAKWVGEAVMPGRKFDLGDYPGALYIYGAKEEVAGEVFEMDDPVALLAILDKYEGIGIDMAVPHEYIRQLCPVRCGDKELICWVYLYNWPLAKD